MSRKILLWPVAALGLLLAAPQAFGATAAGTKVRNTATVTYKIGTVQQTDPDPGSIDFVVDRKVDLSVSTLTPSVDTAPSADNVATVFVVTNNTNDVIDVALTATPQASDYDTAGPDGKLAAPDNVDNLKSTEDFSTATVTLYRDNGTTPNAWDSGDSLVPTDGGVYYINGLAADGGSMTILAVANMPDQGAEGDATKVQNTDKLAVSLDAEARSAYAAPDGSTVTYDSLATPGYGVPTWTVQAGLGATFTEAAGDTAAVDTVFADGADTDSTDGAGNGKDASAAVYLIGGATITVTKRSVVYWDPINQFANPLAIPGAAVLYCISVSNAADGATASSVQVSDAVPANTAFEEGSIDMDGDAGNGVQTLDPDGVGASPALSSSNSIRFTTTNTCAAADWNGATDLEDSDSASEGTGSIGNVTAGVVTTTVDSLVEDTTTTTMFLVKIQ